MDTPTLNPRLAGYLAAAGATIALTPGAHAQVVYTNVYPDAVVSQGENITIDVDGDGTDDFQFISTDPPGANSFARVLFANTNAAATNGVLGVDAPSFSSEALGSASNLAAGAVIGPAGGFYSAGLLASDYNGSPYYNFNGVDGYIGFQFTAGDGAVHYGWARVGATADATVATLYEYAYETQPNTQIEAGNMGTVATEPDALADGYRFSPLAPNPTTGRATFELTLGHPEQVRVEAFDALGRSVAVLQDGQMAAGQTARLALDASGLPAGVYSVRVTGESFTTSRLATVIH